MKPFSCRLTPAQHDALTAINDRQGVDKSQVVRDALDAFLLGDDATYSLPDHAEKMLQVDRIKRENRWNQREAFFYPRTYEYVQACWERGVPPEGLALSLEGYTREADLISLGDAVEFVESLQQAYVNRWTPKDRPPFPPLGEFLSSDLAAQVPDEFPAAAGRDGGDDAVVIEAVQRAHDAGASPQDVLDKFSQFHDKTAVRMAIADVYDTDNA